MIKDGKQHISSNGKDYECEFAGYYNPIQHKWRFRINGTDSDIFHGGTIIFLQTEFTVCYTERDRKKDTGIKTIGVRRTALHLKRQ